MLCSIITYSCGALYFTYSIIIGLNLFHVRKEGEKKKKKWERKEGSSEWRIKWETLQILSECKMRISIKK